LLRNIALLDDALVDRDIVADKLGELLGRHGDWIDAECGVLSPNSGSFMTRATSEFNLLTTAGGVPAGVHMPNQRVMLKPAIPCSAIVGTSGSTAARWDDDTPSAATFPSLISPMAVLIGAM
jgi:hypothetical protein